MNGSIRPIVLFGSLCALAIACLQKPSSSSKGAPVDTTMPPPPTASKGCRGELPQLTRVSAAVRADSVSVTFDPVAGAKDYRIYPLKADGSGPEGDVIYRCAGDRPAWPIPLDLPQWINELGAIEAFVNHPDIGGLARTTAEATLGHVHLTPGDGRVPVYSLGDPAPEGDNPCYQARWDESRVKNYVTSESERQKLLSEGWRDFGIVFYAAAPGAPGVVPVHTALDRGTRYYFVTDSERSARSRLSPTPAFEVLSAPAPGTEPLMRVFYKNGCGRSHDELVAGRGRFENVTRQGSRPVTSLLWSGLTRPTTLVIEALDAGCPFQGHLSPVSKAGWKSPQGFDRQPYLTIDEIRAADPRREVFVNGQHDPGSRPNAIACTQVEAVPVAPETFDFRDGFDTDPGPFTEVPTTAHKGRHFTSPKYDMTFASIEDPMFAFGTMLGEFWVTYGDWAADTNGKFRLTPLKKATLAEAQFLHATMEVDMVTTGRRYPQILISDRDVPVQEGTSNDNFNAGVAIVVESIQDYPGRVDIQLCERRPWDVNNQCPHFVTDWSELSRLNPPRNQPPTPIVGELGGVDRRVRWDVYASTRRVYVLMDGHAMACADLPAGKVPAGPVTVTYGDVLYHSEIDATLPVYQFHNKRLHLETRRHFDELGFRSGVAAPAWDEKLRPCGVTTAP